MNSAHTVSVPQLQTERLVLRAYRRADFDAFAAHFSAHFAADSATHAAADSATHSATHSAPHAATHSAPHAAAHMQDPVSTARLASADRDTAWRIFGSHAGLWLIDGAGWWSVEERQTGQLVGTVGAFFRAHCTVMELGWNTYGAFRGQGFAHEAAAAALHYALAIRREPKVQALIDSANESSLSVARRLGLTYEAQTEMHGKAIGSYTRARED